MIMKRATTTCCLAVAALAFSGASMAADAGNDAAQGQQQGQGQQQTQQLMQQYRQDAQQLKQIHDKTVEANPDLAKEQDQFQEQVKTAVKQNGYDVDKGQKRMQAMAEKLQSKDLSDDEKASTMKKFQAERQKMVSARDAALKDPSVQKAGQQLEQHTIKAMKKQNDKTGDLLSDMEGTRDKLQASMPQQQSGGQ